jgi:hypothetical protein
MEEISIIIIPNLFCSNHDEYIGNQCQARALTYAAALVPGQVTTIKWELGNLATALKVIKVDSGAALMGLTKRIN